MPAPKPKSKGTRAHRARLMEIRVDRAKDAIDMLRDEKRFTEMDTLNAARELVEYLQLHFGV